MGSLLAWLQTLETTRPRHILGGKTSVGPARCPLGSDPANPCSLPSDRPGSEWRLHRHWFDHSALADLLGADFSLVEIHRLYQCHDQLLEHKTALFDHLTERWRTLFDAKYLKELP